MSRAVLEHVAVAFEEAKEMDMLEVEVEHLLLSLLQGTPDLWEILEATPMEIDTLREKVKASIERRRSG